MDIDCLYYSNYFSSHYQNSVKVVNVRAHIDYIHNSTKAFKAMDPKQKNCYLPKNEKKLKHFDEYSEADCMLECTWELGKDLCGCIPWYLGDMYKDVQLCEIFGNRFANAIYPIPYF